jgi:hypothetical protein
MGLLSAPEPQEKFGECRPISEHEARQKLATFKNSGCELCLHLSSALAGSAVTDLRSDALVAEVSESQVIFVLGNEGKLEVRWNPKAYYTWIDEERNRGLFRSRGLEMTDQQGWNLVLLEKTRTAGS